MSNFHQTFRSTIFDKRVEPQQRLVGGRFGYAIHRFPIKGGISMLDLMAANITSNNALYKRMKEGV
jgi:hypothetical protein